ncbi:MAG: permease [Planctomycetota bacterium]
MFEYLVAGGALRLFQTIIYCSVWVVVGCFVAAIFRRMLGPEKVRKLFADDTRYGLLAGWLMGMLLPVCSLGVIPVVREMHRAKVRQGTIIAFGLTAPLFNPMSVLYGLTLSDPIAILSFSFCALLIVSILGYLWNQFPVERSEEDSTDELLPEVGIKRSLAVITTACKELVGPSLVFLLIGIAASVLFSVFVPKGFLQNQVERDNIVAPISVAILGTPIYSTPLLAMSQIGGMFQHGNSIGAGFSLLILGAGANLGLMVWFGWTFGFRRFALFWLMLSSLTILLAYAVDKPLIPKGVEPAGHTHAFDVYTHPFGYGQTNLFQRAGRLMSDFWNANEFGGTSLLGAMIAIGVVVIVVETKDKVDLENWYTTKKETSELGRGFDVALPGWVLGSVAIAGVIAVSIVGCYLYYPAPKDLMPDFELINTEVVLNSKNGKWDAADKWIGYADDLSRRLEVGIFLRNGEVDEFVAAKARIYREELDTIKVMVDARDDASTGKQGIELLNAFRRLKRSCEE